MRIAKVGKVIVHELVSSLATVLTIFWTVYHLFLYGVWSSMWLSNWPYVDTAVYLRIHLLICLMVSAILNWTLSRFFKMKGGNIVLFWDFLTVWSLLESFLLNKKKIENTVLGWLEFGFPWSLSNNGLSCLDPKICLIDL